MELGLNEKVAIITGSSKGIGYYTAMQLVKEGVNVVLCARGEKQLQVAADYIKNETGKEVLIVPTDITKEKDCQRLIEQTITHYGRLDIVVNNAGTASANPFESVSSELWQADLDLKVFGAIHCTKYAIPHMRKVGGGAIVNVTAVMAKTPPASSLPTTVSRAAGLALTKAMSKDLGKDNIRVNAVCIGLIRSDQIEKKWKKEASQLSWEEYSQQVGQTIPLGRVGDTQEAANVITFLVSEAASYVTGTTVNIDGGAGHAL
ncbi:SDR family NAD(P)-dependent oxidoreductase [Lysinibacillus piscis]|uniref:Short-chain dehydrogenase n=1 Tax=Lysinibacillus piscis TaxID=2518931 RepID=A0ABQ5NH45_9BACI|nr:SDR family oxidoreductase [Lysinibacillus sp. KH24]GLC87608.1 short-chain dehydrogenase [Lysinibacillus sp. KH24]